MSPLCKLEREDLLCAVQLAAFPAFHLFNLVKRQERQHLDALQNVAVVYVSPVLVEIERGSFVRVKPHGVAGGFAHLLALRIGEQGDGHGCGILAEFSADELRAAEHVAPLVVAAEL